MTGFSNCAFALDGGEDKYVFKPGMSGNVPSKDRIKRMEIYSEVETERIRQDKKFGSHNNYIPSDWLMVLGEEVGEVNEAALTARFSTFGMEGKTKEEIDQKKKAALEHMREELVQVAAVAVAIVESLDRNELKKEEIEKNDKKAESTPASKTESK